MRYYTTYDAKERAHLAYSKTSQAGWLVCCSAQIVMARECAVARRSLARVSQLLVAQQNLGIA